MAAQRITGVASHDHNSSLAALALAAVRRQQERKRCPRPRRIHKLAPATNHFIVFQMTIRRGY